MEQVITCLVVDDEPYARDLMENYIARIPFLQPVAFCENAFDAIDVLQRQSVDLLFSDIQMPNINGIEMIRSLSNPPFVVFTTASPAYAITGFELDAVDYLVKPISFERFLKAVNKARSHIQQKKQQFVQEVVKQQPNHLFVKDGYKLSKVLFEDIYYVEGMKDYIKIVCKQKNIITYMRMKVIEDTLPPDQFVRIHKSYIVRIQAIRSIVGNSAELINNESVIISKSNRQDLIKLLGITNYNDGEE
ncbi:LytR/AlgR family response regulator transcription factor [Chitinophaga nivalis]|uniref:LytTR family DNA-binding domain-containing protein n=1 Tax=Chitinophaga nivalis TaxID=2991709 RepID=A0ABT3IU33_9BACT|nr:LytTR family DNA-binding domain-containing protein [Chitinophaga nivalis]MCW3462841.1 LytTR family DNA-binding domain-containing protein [Chitinophaga nivalis]MCW3487469.1 LytTR family DNA-binding domain-containing protein [Chitinophaga nivalis]